MQYTWLIYLVVCVVGAYPALLLATLIHEIGHALFATIAGYWVTSFGLGYGKPICRLRLPGNILFYICKDYWGYGNCWTTSKELIESPWRKALLLLGGVLTNFLVAGLLFTLYYQPMGWIFTALALFNLFVAVTNLVPFHLQPTRQAGWVSTDGMKLIQSLFARRRPAENPAKELQFYQLWEDIQDTRAQRYHLALAARAVLLFGGVPIAQQWLDKAEMLPPDESDAHLMFLRFQLAAREQNQRQDLLDIAADDYRRLGSESGIFFTTFYQDLYGFRQKPDYALHPLTSRPLVATMIAAAQLGAFLADTASNGNFAQQETLLARFEACRRRYRADVLDWNTYIRVAVWRKENGDTAGALLAFEKAQQPLREMQKAISGDAKFVSAWAKAMSEMLIRYGFPVPDFLPSPAPVSSHS